LFEIVDVLPQLGLPGICDRRHHDRIHHGFDLVARIELGIELGKPRAVDAAGEGIAAGERPALEAAQAKQRVLRPTDRLAELAVADDVDADISLLAHDLGNGLLQALGIGGVVERPAGLFGAQERAQRRRADEAADMGGEDSIGAAFHLASSPTSRRSSLLSATTA
jgi:hypothetical protein